MEECEERAFDLLERIAIALEKLVILKTPEEENEDGNDKEVY